MVGYFFFSMVLGIWYEFGYWVLGIGFEFGFEFEFVFGFGFAI